MKAEPGVDQCLSFIHAQLQPSGRTDSSTANRWRAVTLSRQTGAGGHAVAEALAERLHATEPAGSLPWTVFDRNLAEKVLEDHRLPARLAKFMPEDRVSEIDDALATLCQLHPPASTLVEITGETIRRLVELGSVILLGRGANIVTSGLNDVFHVRLVGSLDKRVEHVQKTERLGRKAALEFVHVHDRGRQRYLKKYFDKDINNPLLYHLVMNTDLIGHQQAASIIADIMLSSRPALPEKRIPRKAGP